jgi:hypothetical protein
VASLLREAKPGASFLTTYQQRRFESLGIDDVVRLPGVSIARTIVPFLDMYGLSATEIPTKNFLHKAHSEGTCVVSVNSCGGGLKEQEIAVFDSIYLLKFVLS